jgi:hypothetical protein
MIKEKILPSKRLEIIFQLISFLFNQALYPFEVVCMRPWRTMAGATGSKLTNIPMRINPPSIPKIEERKAVAKVARTIIRKKSSNSTSSIT